MLFCSLSSFAQLPVSLNDLRLKDDSISLVLATDAYAASNAYSNRYLFSVFGSTPDQPANLLSHSRPIVNVGVDYTSGLSFSSYIKDQPFFVSLEDRLHAHAQFTDDLYEFSIMGNQFFEDQQMIFSGSNFTNFRVQSLGLGTFFSSRTNQVSLGLQLNYLNPNFFFRAKSLTGYLYTAENGSYLDLSSELEGQSAGSLNNGFLRSNGSGVSLNVFLNTQIQLLDSEKPHANLTLELTDVGFLNLNKNVRQFKQDTLILGYRGVDLFEINNLDSLSEMLDFNLQENTESFNYTLPFYAHLSLEQKFAQHSLKIGVINRNLEAYKTYVYLSDYHRLSDHFSALYQLGYGGYSYFNLGSGLRYTNQHFDIQLNTRNITAFLAQKNRLNTHFSLIFTTYF